MLLKMQKSDSWKGVKLNNNTSKNFILFDFSSPWKISSCCTFSITKYSARPHKDSHASVHFCANAEMFKEKKVYRKSHSTWKWLWSCFAYIWNINFLKNKREMLIFRFFHKKKLYCEICVKKLRKKVPWKKYCGSNLKKRSFSFGCRSNKKFWRLKNL